VEDGQIFEQIREASAFHEMRELRTIYVNPADYQKLLLGNLSLPESWGSLGDGAVIIDEL
jgi:hypothetical protein